MFFFEKYRILLKFEIISFYTGGTFDLNSELKQFLGLPVWQKLDEADDYDVCLLTSLTNTKSIYDFLRKKLDLDKILVPSILGLNAKDIIRK